MAQTLYVASSNPGKLRDFEVAASEHGVAVLPLPGLATITAPPEDEPTFAGNAQSKALYYSEFVSHELVLADDSGLEVDYLQGAPGVRSARYASDAGFHPVSRADGNNNLFLLHQLAGVIDQERTARYRCALAVARDGQCVFTTDGMVEGRILVAPRGAGGFGYDPLFFLPSLEQTMAEIDDHTRWNLSHRGLAFRKLLPLLAQAG